MGPPFHSANPQGEVTYLYLLCQIVWAGVCSINSLLENVLNSNALDTVMVRLRFPTRALTFFSFFFFKSILLLANWHAPPLFFLLGNTVHICMESGTECRKTPNVEILDLGPFALEYPMPHLTNFFLRFPISQMEESLLHFLPPGEGIPWKSMVLCICVSTHFTYPPA